MSKVRCSVSKESSPLFKEALREAGIKEEVDNEKAILIWFEEKKNGDYFSMLKPWQNVNRIPSMNVFCRKTSFSRLIQRAAKYFPHKYKFFPKTYPLPYKNADFLRALSHHKSSWIIKPDNDNPGKQNILIPHGKKFFPTQDLSVAQEVIESFTIDNRKFDLKIYVLIASVTPLYIFVYRDGIARFSSEDEGKDPVRSHIADESSPVDLISNVFQRLEEECLIDIDEIWEKIDNVVSLSIFAGYDYIKESVKKNCYSNPISRCFQLIGFDILLDKDLEPHVLDVSYNPSLDYRSAAERRMKVEMLSQMLPIANPLDLLQGAFHTRENEWDTQTWSIFLKENPILHSWSSAKRIVNAEKSKFKCAFPPQDKELKETYNNIIDKLESLKREFLPGLNPECDDDDDENQ